MEHNELTNYDLVILKSSLEVIYNPALQCSRCILKTDERYREQRKGCTGKTEFKREAMEGIFYTKCPGNFYVDSYAQLLDVHRLYRKGILAFGGGLLEQPAKYLEAMNYLEVLITQKETENLKKSLKHGRK